MHREEKELLLRCHPERTREGSGARARGQILHEYVQDDKLRTLSLSSLCAFLCVSVSLARYSERVAHSLFVVVIITSLIALTACSTPATRAPKPEYETPIADASRDTVTAKS